MFLQRGGEELPRHRPRPRSARGQVPARARRPGRLRRRSARRCGTRCSRRCPSPTARTLITKRSSPGVQPGLVRVGDHRRIEQRGRLDRVLLGEVRADQRGARSAETSTRRAAGGRPASKWPAEDPAGKVRVPVAEPRTIVVGRSAAHLVGGHAPATRWIDLVRAGDAVGQGLLAGQEQLSADHPAAGRPRSTSRHLPATSRGHRARRHGTGLLKGRDHGEGRLRSLVLVATGAVQAVDSRRR